MRLKEIKFFLIIFIIFFTVNFILFVGLGVFDIVSYKLKNLFQEAKEEILSPPSLLPVEDQNQEKEVKKEKEILKENLKKYFSQYQGQRMLILEKFNIKAPIIVVNQQDLNLIYKKLKEGVVLFPRSDLPGKGYSVIIGHSSQYPWQEGNYKTVFSLLGELEKGDKVYIIWEKRGLVFEVEESKIFLPWSEGGQTTEMVFPKEEKPLLILQSCWPQGVAKKRIAVKTVLILEQEF
ncbi:MAG: sortase [Candidatus Paceibacterota bacterium]